MSPEAMLPTDRVCLLAARAGRAEVCTEDCPLWEHGQCQLEAILDPSADLEQEQEDEEPA